MRALTLGLTLVMWVLTSGCVTSLGYYPDNVKVRDLDPQAKLTPTYVQVKQWAYDVHDGFDTRVAINRYATHFGALFGVAAAGAVAGLAIFDSSSAALKGIPIGTAFLSGAAAVYNNEQKAALYRKAADYVKELINVSQERERGDNDTWLAGCLKKEVDRVLRKVHDHVIMMDPQNVVSALANVKSAANQAEITKLVQAARGDFSNLVVPADLRARYCGDLPDLADAAGNVAFGQTALSLLEQRLGELRVQLALAPAVADLRAKAQRLTDNNRKNAANERIQTFDEALTEAKGVEKTVGQELTKAEGGLRATASSLIKKLREESLSADKIMEAAADLAGTRRRLEQFGEQIVQRGAALGDATRKALEALAPAK